MPPISRIAVILLACTVFVAGCKKEAVEPAAVPVAPIPPTPGPGENYALTMGNPSHAIASIITPNNYLLERPQYSLAYDNSRGTAKWDAWHLSTAWLGNEPRCDCFSPDPLLPTGYFVAYTYNYTNTTFSIANGNITVPERYWKIILILPEGTDDLSRVDATTRVTAVDMPNNQYANTQPWYDYRTSVDEIEAVTGLDFLNALPVDLQEMLEGGVDTGAVH